MSSIEDIVDSLENKISKILHKLEVLKQTNSKLKEELVVSEQNLQNQRFYRNHQFLFYVFLT